jgi:hypothetical protein
MRLGQTAGDRQAQTGAGRGRPTALERSKQAFAL